MDYLAAAEEKIEELEQVNNRLKEVRKVLRKELELLYGMFVEELGLQHRLRILDLLGKEKD